MAHDEFYAVVIHSFWQEWEPWVSVFSTKEAADSFARKARSIIEAHGFDEEILVAFDAGAVDSEMYLECLDMTLDDYMEKEGK